MNRKKKYLVLDTETANGLDFPLVYDIGYAVCDRYGEIYETGSFVIKDVFYYCPELMQSAYYAEKLPLYDERIRNGETKACDFMLVKWIINDVIQRYNIKAVCAYNARFDLNALNTTTRYLTKSKFRYFLPYGVDVNCIQHMACQVLYTSKAFAEFALENEYFSNSGKFLSTTAEIGHRFLTGNTEFEEEHTGLADVLIEVDIMTRCFAKKKAMKRNINPACYSIPTRVHKQMIAEWE